MRLHPWGWGTSHPEGTSDCADEVTLSRKGAKSQQHVRGLRSTGTKARTHVERLRATNADLKKKLDEALEQQTATAEVLKVISSLPGELDVVFQAMLENAIKICEANFGNLFTYSDNSFRVVAQHNAPPAYREFWAREPIVIAGRRTASSASSPRNFEERRSCGRPRDRTGLSSSAIRVSWP